MADLLDRVNAAQRTLDDLRVRAARNEEEHDTIRRELDEAQTDLQQAGGTSGRNISYF